MPACNISSTEIKAHWNMTRSTHVLVETGLEIAINLVEVENEPSTIVQGLRHLLSPGMSDQRSELTVNSPVGLHKRFAKALLFEVTLLEDRQIAPLVIAQASMALEWVFQLKI